VSTRCLVHLAAVLLVVAGLCSISQAAPLAGPSSPINSTASNPAVASSCSLPAFLAAPLTPAPSPASPAVCACGDAACNGHIALTSCGQFRVCVPTGGCASSAAKSCACVTQDPPR
jgi:hypothetical protein